MKIIKTKKYAASKGPKMETLKKNRTVLSDEERKEVMSRGVTWHHGPNGENTPAVWKSIVDGKTWYVCNTHRAFQCKSTLKGAIKAFDFIETTANKKNKIKIAQLKEVELKGILRKTKNNFVYLDIPNNIINGFISMLDYEGVDKPPYNLKSFNNVGAHISVIGTDEYKDNNIEEIKEIGKEFNFTFKDMKFTNPKGWDEMKKVYFIRIDAPDLEKIRIKYNLSKKIDGHDFHITIGVEKNN